MPLDLEWMLKTFLESQERVQKSQERINVGEPSENLGEPSENFGEPTNNYFWESREDDIKKLRFCAAYPPPPPSPQAVMKLMSHPPQTGINLMKSVVRETIGSIVRDTNFGMRMAIKHLILPHLMMKKKLTTCWSWFWKRQEDDRKDGSHGTWDNKLTQGTEEQEEKSIPFYNNNSYESHTTYM